MTRIYKTDVISAGLIDLYIDSCITGDAFFKINKILQDAFVCNVPSEDAKKMKDDEGTYVDYSIKSDKGKYKPTLCHKSLIEAVATVREYGARKYGDNECWKRVEEQRYKDALYRHWLAYLENPDGIDSDSGLLTLWHVACNVDFLVEMQKERMKKNEESK